MEELQKLKEELETLESQCRFFSNEFEKYKNNEKINKAKELEYRFNILLERFQMLPLRKLENEKIEYKNIKNTMIYMQKNIFELRDKAEEAKKVYKEKQDKERAVKNLKTRKNHQKLAKKWLLVGAITAALTGGSILAFLGAANKKKNDQNNKDRAFMSSVLYEGDNFNNDVALKYFEEIGINEENVVKDQACYHIICQKGNEIGEEISEEYIKKAKAAGIKNVDSFSIDQVQAKIDEWSNFNSDIQMQLHPEFENADDLPADYYDVYHDIIKTYDTDIDKEHIFIYLAKSHDGQDHIVEEYNFFSPVTKKALATRGMKFTKSDKEFIYNSDLIDTDDKLIFGLKTDNVKYTEYSIIPPVDIQECILETRKDLTEEEIENIANSLFEATVLNNLKGQNYSSSNKLLENYDKINFDFKNNKNNKR